MLLLEEKKNRERKKGKCLDDDNTFYMGIANIAIAPPPPLDFQNTSFTVPLSWGWWVELRVSFWSWEDLVLLPLTRHCLISWWKLSNPHKNPDSRSIEITLILDPQVVLSMVTERQYNILYIIHFSGPQVFFSIVTERWANHSVSYQHKQLINRSEGISKTLWFSRFSKKLEEKTAWSDTSIRSDSIFKETFNSLYQQYVVP